MTVPRPSLWWGLAAMSVILVLFGVGDIAAGLDADPAITVALLGLSPGELREESAAGYRLADYMARSGGLVLTTLGIALTVLVAVPYRRRAGWSWRAMWLLPAWALTVPVGFLLVGTMPDQPPPPPMISGPIFAVLAGAILLADRRAFVRAAPVGDGAESSRPKAAVTATAREAG